jgi:hypothetical protein
MNFDLIGGFDLCLGVLYIALVLMRSSECLDVLNGGGWGYL